MKKHYQTLGLEPGASQEAIQAAYDKLSIELDPKNNNNQDFFIEEYAKLQEAYKALGNYDILATEKGANKGRVLKKEKNKEEQEISKKTNVMVKGKILKKLVIVIIIISLSGIFIVEIEDREITRFIIPLVHYTHKDVVESNGVMYTFHNMKLFNGVLYSNIRREGLYINGIKEGEHNKYHHSYSENQISEKSYYSNGKLEGLYREWYDNGQLLKECNYSNGKLEGVYKQWYRTGQLHKEVNYKKGTRSGFSKEWNNEGYLIAIDYNQNEIVKYLQDYLRTSNNLNLIEGAYKSTIDKDPSRYEFTIISLSGQFYAVMTNNWKNIGEESALFSVGDIKASFSKTADINKFNSTWFMGNKSIEKDEVFYDKATNQIDFHSLGFSYQKQ